MTGRSSPLRVQQEQWAHARLAAVRELAAALVRRGAQSIILFGSLAAGETVGPDSDVDLVVVLPGIEQVRFHKRLVDAEEVLRFPFPLDLAVYSPGEWEHMRERSFVQNEILGRGVVLH